MRIKDYDGFAELLDDAERNASTDWEMDFIQDLQERIKKFEDETFISEKQLVVLERLASQ